MLTKKEAIQFAKDLGIMEPETELERNKASFLNKVVSSIQEKIPFQGVTLQSKLLKERRNPTLEEVKTTMLERKGGICYEFNLFTFFLLRSLGYDAYVNICQVIFNGTLADNHLIVLVKNLKESGDLYLVDTGCARPTFEAINLDFQTESQIFHDSFTRYKFIKTDNKIRRIHDCISAELVSPKPMSDTKSDAFQLFYEFEIKPILNYEEFSQIFDDIYRNPDLTVFHKSLRALRFPDKKLVVIVNSRVVLEDDQGKFSITMLKDDEDLKEAYLKYFPEFDESTIVNAIKNWRIANVRS